MSKLLDKMLGLYDQGKMTVRYMHRFKSGQFYYRTTIFESDKIRFHYEVFDYPEVGLTVNYSISDIIIEKKFLGLFWLRSYDVIEITDEQKKTLITAYRRVKAEYDEEQMFKRVKQEDVYAKQIEKIINGEK